MRPPGKPHGFTLVELLIALALTGIVSLLVLAGMRFSALAFEHVAGQAERLEARSNLETLLRRELGAAFATPLSPSAPALTGGPDRIAFLTLAEDSGAGLYRVTLVAEPFGGDRRLVLSRRRLGAIGALGTERVVLAPHLRQFTIAYFGISATDPQPQWQARWDTLRFPPALVRIAIDTGDGLVRPPLVVRLWGAPP